MRQKQRPAAWSAIGLIVCVIIGGIAWTNGVSLVKLSDIFFMIGLALIVIGVVMQLSHACQGQFKNVGFRQKEM
ncbi:hypothetical protein [Furfurilactobacillus rossiae]|uniref:hypothetical protein n=1 Tax=Furfurilactobacillus rossiae TaxID=231049 RepID=UPI003B981342